MSHDGFIEEYPRKISEDCQHDWVHRKDGYEEQCSPAICRKCGKYGCFCDFKRDNGLFAIPFDKELFIEKKKYFFENGINGNNHEIERQKKTGIKEKTDQVSSDFISSRFEILDL